MQRSPGAGDSTSTPATDLMSIRRVPVLVLLCVACAAHEVSASGPASAFVALMAGQRARPLNGVFNNVPVLHSNQPEIVTGPGILVDTAPGSAIAAETGRPLRNAEYTFNGEFGDEWNKGDTRESKLVFIGKNLDKEALKEGFTACVMTPELIEKKRGMLRFAVGEKVDCIGAGGCAVTQ